MGKIYPPRRPVGVDLPPPAPQTRRAQRTKHAGLGVASARWDLASDESGRRDQRCRRSVLCDHVTSQRLRGILSRAAYAVPLAVCVQRRRDCCAAWLQRVRPGLPTVDDGSSGTGAGPAAARPLHDQGAGDCCTNEQQQPLPSSIPRRTRLGSSSRPRVRKRHFAAPCIPQRRLRSR